VNVPSLEERVEDILPLLQHVLALSKQLGATSKFEPSPEFVNELKRREWPGNVGQFRACLLEAFATPLEMLDDIAATDSLGETESRLLWVLDEALDRWGRFRNCNGTIPDAFVVRETILESFGNYRIAAAKLGVGVQQIREALQPRGNVVQPRESHDVG
ncbi:MAG: hypothetical protein KDD44_13790, partial [Bdellovibrionales bacterium]|nr:hypothetical protein [Bdellovibrionales bacterium]